MLISCPALACCISSLSLQYFEKMEGFKAVPYEDTEENEEHRENIKGAMGISGIPVLAVLKPTGSGADAKYNVATMDGKAAVGMDKEKAIQEWCGGKGAEFTTEENF